MHFRISCPTSDFDSFKNFLESMYGTLFSLKQTESSWSGRDQSTANCEAGKVGLIIHFPGVELPLLTNVSGDGVCACWSKGRELKSHFLKRCMSIFKQPWLTCFIILSTCTLISAMTNPSCPSKTFLCLYNRKNKAAGT